MMHIAIVEDCVFDQKHLIDLIQKNFEEHGEMADFTCYESGEGAVALANIFCWAAALLYAQMGAKSVVICPIPYKHSSFPDIPFGMPDFKLFCFQPLKSMLSLMKKDDSPFFRSESCYEAY